jgi:hypothetical protein
MQVLSSLHLSFYMLANRPRAHFGFTLYSGALWRLTVCHQKFTKQKFGQFRCFTPLFFFKPVTHLKLYFEMCLSVRNCL